jgi:hypothetical protein
MRWVLWTVAAGTVGLGLAVSCSNSSGVQGPASDGGMPDGRSPVDSGPGERNGGDDGGRGTDAASGEPDAGPPGCYTVKGSGSTQTCTFASSPGASAGCSGNDAGSTFGHCPSADLFGCCVMTTPDDAGAEGGSALTATCYYSADAGANPYKNCGTEAYEGLPYLWQMTVP